MRARTSGCTDTEGPGCPDASRIHSLPTRRTNRPKIPVHAALPGDVIPAVGFVVSPLGGGLFTVPVTGDEGVVLPAASRATAVSVCVPFAAVVVAQVIAYGADVSSVARFAPSSLNCTP